MRILALADEESTAIWEHYKMNPITDTDLIISCGDLNPRYLSFLVSMTNLPLLYVHGNHDDKYADVPPDGCICIDDTIFVYEGVRFLGLGGCLPYRQGRHMYSEKEMQKRIHKLKRELKKYGGFDVLVTHAPARGQGDGDDMPHRGYEAFLELLEQYAPEYMLHGHMHLQYDSSLPRLRTFGETTIVNCYEKYALDINPENPYQLSRWDAARMKKRMTDNTYKVDKTKRYQSMR